MNIVNNQEENQITLHYRQPAIVEIVECASPARKKLILQLFCGFMHFPKLYDLREWARKLYGGLENKAYKCDGCRQCTSRCLYNLAIVEKLEEADKTLR